MRLRQFLHWSSAILIIVAALWLSHAFHIGSTEPESRPFFVGWLNHLYANPFITYFSILGASGVAKLFEAKLERARRKSIVQSLLNGLVSEVMETEDPFIEQNYRVTVFRWHKWSFRAWWRNSSQLESCSPWSGWLLPYSRSGSGAMQSKSCFLAPSVIPMNPQTGHGFAGTAWVQRVTKAHGLWNLHGDEAAIADAYHLSTKEYRKRKIEEEKGAGALANTYHAELIDPGGQKLGVLVYDSVLSNPIIIGRDQPNSNESGHALALAGIGAVLQEGE